MTRTWTFPALLLALLVAAPAAQAAEHLFRSPDLHGDVIVFTYEDDLWRVDAAGGDAVRLTSDEGAETSAKFSPDGSLLAFTAEYDGGSDVYVMDARGGEPRRLTYHPAMDQVLGWHPDGRRVLFRSNRAWPNREFETYLVSVDGGLPERLPIDRGGLAALDAAGERLAYNRISRENRTWKRYRGGMAQDVWVADLRSGAIVQATDWPGTDNFPMWWGERIVFTSDREDGRLNLYSMAPDGADVRRLTFFTDYDVKNPSLGDRGRVVFQQGGRLHVLDLATGAERAVPVRVRSDHPRFRTEFLTAAPSAGSFRLAPGAGRVLVEARGEILNLPVDEGDALDLTQASGSREKDAAWSPDGKHIVFISDRTGEEELWLCDQRGGNLRRLTDAGAGFKLPPVWSPDSAHVLYGDKFLRLNLVDVRSGKTRTIAQGEYDDAWERWGILDYSWSPDSRWVAYARQNADMNETVHLYALDTGATMDVTDDWFTSWSPSFSPDGNYLYFLSNRTFTPRMGKQDQNHVFLDMTRPYVALLRADAVSPFAAPDGMLAADDGAGDGKKKDGEAKDAPVRVTVDAAGLADRILACEGVPAGDYDRLEAVDGGFLYLARTAPEFLKYQTVNDRTGGALELRRYGLDDAEVKPVIAGVTNYHLAPDGGKLVYRAGSKLGVVAVDAESKPGDGAVALDGVRLQVDRRAEYLQIFDEAWRIQRDWFYDPGMHGVDWNAVRAQYRPLVADCGTRGDLNYLIGEMISELNIGHTYIFGGDFSDGAPRVPVGLLGVDLSAGGKQKYYRIDRILRGESWDPDLRSPLAAPGCGAAEGDLLVAIDGVEVTTADNPYRLLQDKAGEWVTLSLNAMPGAKGAKTCRVRTLRSEAALRYHAWKAANRAAVDAASDGRIAYLHLPNMMEDGLVEFGRDFYPQTDRQALIVDERYNGGGFVGDMIIDRLERKLWSLNQPREGKPGRNPERVFHGPIVVLINEDTGSNGEYFAYAVQAKGLAPLIGMRTWGGAVGIEPHQDMVDGGGTTPPQFGPVGLDGAWIIEGHGVVPDIVVQNMPADVVAGRDAQLDTAVRYLLDTLAKEGARWILPEVPDYPDKSR